MTQEVFLTAQGCSELEKRLELLKTVERAKISERIKVAREFGDISENAEYDAAKNDQAQIEGEIAEIEFKLKNAKIIEEGGGKDIASIGSSVTVVNVNTKKEETYKIVGTTESDPVNKKISNESPVGKALLGGRVGQIVTAVNPSGVQIKYKILKIS